VISDDERNKRQKAYEISKKASIARGVELTPETEVLMSRYINGEIDDLDFFTGIAKIAEMEVAASSTKH
jgi:hypothetical protein